MKKLKILRIAGGALSVIGLIGLGASSFATPSMIIAMGVRGLDAVSKISGIVIGAGIVSAAGGTVPAIVSSVKAKNQNRLLESGYEADRKNFSEYARDSLNPEKTRARLEQLRKNNPKLSEIVDSCLEQLDKIDTYQSRHKSLLAANEAIYLQDTIEALEESEKRMCRNFRNIINCCILVENDTGNNDELDRNTINAYLADNEEELKSAGTLLKYSVAYINNYNRSGVSDRSELDAWISVMKASLGGNDETY